MAVSRETVAAIRWGYGFRPGEAAPAATADAMVAGLAAAEVTRVAVPSIADLYAAIETQRAARQAQDKVPNGRQMLRAARTALDALRRPLLQRRIAEPVLSPQGFRERMVTFWADHFTVASKGLHLQALAPHFVETAIRPHVGDRFAELLVAAETHPAMLLYLNQSMSIGPNSPAGAGKRGLNENLARETLELHTLGVKAGYTQADVRELAELLTGFTVEDGVGTVFRPRRAEPGAETILGKTYGGDRPSAEDAKAALADLAVHPATARHIAEKLVVHFISDTPDAGHVGQVAEAWTGSGGDLPVVYRALLDHPSAWAPGFTKARQPFDFLIALLRAFGAGAPGPLQDMESLGRLAEKQLAELGQKLLDPPGPNGWPEEADAWITPQGLAARVTVARQHARTAGAGLDPRAFLDATLRDAAGPELSFAVSAAEQKWEGILLTLLSPEFNRR